VRAQIKLCLKARDDASATRSLPLTTIAKPMNRFAACGDPRAERGQGSKDDQGRNDRLVQIGPEGLAASAHVMGRPQDRAPYWVTEGGAYQMLLVALIEAEREPPDEYRDVLGLTR
jgi:hypothetical protein